MNAIAAVPAIHESPLGRLTPTAGPRGISGLRFGDDKTETGHRGRARSGHLAVASASSSP